MKRLLTPCLLAWCLISPITNASDCQVHFTSVDVNVRKALTIGSKFPQWQAREKMCERLSSFDGAISVARSEEHTSELQSRPHLVCRLLLEKKKNKTCKNANQQCYYLNH